MIINITGKKKIIAKSEKILRNKYAHALGLMFHRKIEDVGYVFVFNKKRRIQLHMCFVFFPIDVVFLDEKNKVVEIANLKPFTFYNSKQEIKNFIELPCGSVKKSGIKLGNIIKFPENTKSI